MINFFKKNKFLIFVLLIASLLRLWQLGSVPPSPDWDEAALGYNAYSILQTGKDEYGKFMPVVLQSFDDYKPALYTYLIIPLLPIFGLDILAVRLPSVIAGVFAVWLTYLIVKGFVSSQISVVGSKEKINSLQRTENRKLIIPLLVAFMLAISPWHIQFSRVAFEANLGVTLNLAMIYFFMRGLSRPLFLSFSAVFAGLSLYAYQSEKIFVPLLVLVMIFIYRKEIFSLPKKYLVSAFLTGVLVVLPMLHFIIFNENALGRAESTTIFANNQKLLEPSVNKLIEATNNNDFVGIILNNRRFVYTQSMLHNYFASFSPQWLFLTGDIPRHHAPGTGLLYLWELPFLLLGLVVLLFTKQSIFNTKEKVFLFAWFLIAPLPSIITTDVPHAVRTLNFLPTFQIFTAVGLVTAFFYFKKDKFLRIVFTTLFGLFFIFNLLFYINQYFVMQNKDYSSEWQYGYEQAVTIAESEKNDYEKVVVSNQSPLDQSYIFFLYYLKFPPHVYQSTVGNNKTFDKYEFRPIIWKEDQKLNNTLFIGSPKDFPKNISAFKTVRYLNGKPAILFMVP